MYLKMIKEDEQKKVFMQLANIVAIACEEPESSAGESEEERSMRDIGKRSVDIVEMDSWKPSAKEKKILSEYWKEMECDEGITMYPSVYVNTSDMKEVIEELDSALRQVKSLDETARRKAVVEKMIDECVDWEGLEESVQPKRKLLSGQVNARGLPLVKIKKIMLIELVGLAMVDDDYADLERHAIALIAQKFGIDDDELEEMKEFISSYMTKFDEGLEIINS